VVPPPVRFKSQPTNTKQPSAPNGTNMNNWGTMPGVNLHKPKLNSSDFQVSCTGIFWDPSTVEGHCCLVQECYGFINAMTNILLNNLKLTIQNPSNLIISKILTFLGKIYWNGFEIWHSWCDNFFETFLMHKSMTSFWQGQFWIKVPANLAWSKLHILLSSQF
jgi:hypothetical protein